ncbi:hypothetical protein GCM10011507_32420 [Edaphobacter acidisoli]|uniref:HTH marR-type domain-containing protein n=2 Tax=Edaphobacter acidisoli TaxID=2040573 RepID=A0A916S041_9BACT|nr:hypothetical protein GCM10011507_32420 [Edaphobacter acidisoli]
MYNRELRPSGLELSQYTLLMSLGLAGEITQKGLGKLLAMDSTTLTRTLVSLVERGWVSVEEGEDRREKRLALSSSGRRKLEQARPHWERAQRKLSEGLGDRDWELMGKLLTSVAETAGQA